MWDRFDPYELATPEAFGRQPHVVNDFYNLRRAALLEAQPNAAHFALAELGAALDAAGGRLTLVTQNIDDLHERAGNDNVIHMHGELLKVRCDGVQGGGCLSVVDWRWDLSLSTPCPICSQIGYLRPHVVWFNEAPMHLDDIAEAIENADLFVSIGTSGTVWPAAGFVLAARDQGVETLELNLEPTDGGAVFDRGVYGPATDVVPRWVQTVCDSLATLS